MRKFRFALALLLWAPPSLAGDEARINAWIAAAPAGATLRLPARLRLDGPIVIRGKQGLTLVPAGDGPSLVDGQRGPTHPRLRQRLPGSEGTRAWDGESEWIPVYPSFHGFAALRIEDSQGVHVEGLAIRRSWPNGVEIRGRSRDISLARLSMEGGTNFLFAHGREVERVSVRNSRWVQDPNAHVWGSLDWAEVHHGRWNFFNGAFVQARDVKGSFVVEGNVVRNAFNGLRFLVSPGACRSEESCALNRGVRVVRNLFQRIADNVIEPEGRLENWDVRENQMISVYAPISLDGVQARGFRLARNLVVANELPRLGVPRYYQGRHQGGRLFKCKAVSVDDKPALEDFVVTENYFHSSDAAQGVRFPVTDVRRLPDTVRFERNHFPRDQEMSETDPALPEEWRRENYFDL